MKFARIVPQINTDAHRLTRSRIFDLTSHFQDGGHDVILLNNLVSQQLSSSVRQFLICSTFVYTC